MAEHPDTSTSRPLILHVAESYAGGVRAAIDDYVRNTGDTHDHALLYAPRADAPLHDATFDRFVWVERLPKGHAARVRSVRRSVASLTPTVLHAHSSFGGAYARVAVSRARQQIVYTPHCYASERQDIGRMTRLAFALLENALSFNTTVVAACSPREAQIADRAWSRPRTVYVPNVPPAATSSASSAVSSAATSTRLRVVASGRASAQKDPEFFRDTVHAARESGLDVEAIWIGGDDTLREAFAPHGIEVTGWLTRSEIERIMRSASAYVHTARWEGFPIALLEVERWRVPAIIRRIPAFDAFSFPLLIDSPSDAAMVIDRLQDTEFRAAALRGTEAALAFNTAESQRDALRSAYRRKGV